MALWRVLTAALLYLSSSINESGSYNESIKNTLTVIDLE